MQIGVIGINHKLATLALRENLVKGIVARLKKTQLHYIYLATCNRIEIYFSHRDLAAAHSQLLQLLCEHMEEEVAHKFYSYFGEDCFLHLARVTAGLDSAILFETEIQGQVKRAYEQVALEHRLCPEMHFLFQKSLSIGKKVRSLFPQGQSKDSLEERIVRAGHSLFGSLLEKRFLFVGVSEINRRIAHYIRRLGVKQIEFCNRSLEKELLLKGLFTLRGLDHLARWPEYDVTIFGTTCPEYLLEKGVRLEQERLLIDLSVPRNVAPSLGDLPYLTLLNVEQIDGLIQMRDEREAKEVARIEAEQIMQSVRNHLARFHAREHAFAR